MLAIAAKLCPLARLLAVLATVLPVGTVLGNHTLAAGMCALGCVGHGETPRGHCMRLTQESQAPRVPRPFPGDDKLIASTCESFRSTSASFARSWMRTAGPV